MTADLGVDWRELSVLDDPQLLARYAERIPVVLVDGRSTTTGGWTSAGCGRPSGVAAGGIVADHSPVGAS